MNNVQSISDAYLCSNCGACSAVCPKGAISFESTSMGRMYAKVDSKCVDCGLCVKVCPSVEPPAMDSVSDRYIGNVISVNVGRSTDDAIYHNAQSGGACTAILTYLFDTGAIDCAIVCRMSFGNPPVVESVLITDKDDLKACQKSCYTPVEMLSKLRSAKRYKSVAVVGLPCHIQGLTKILQNTKLLKNVNYKLGLVCHGTLCGSIQNVMLSYVPDGEYKIDWKHKDFTHEGLYHAYKDAPVTVYKKTMGGGKVFSNVYRFALRDMFTSPRCRVCFDKVCIFADIVLGDPWRMPDVDWNHGDSLIVARTERGENIIQTMKQKGLLTLSKRDVSELINGQLIAERKCTVAAFTRALESLPARAQSYLYTQPAEGSVDDSAVSKAASELQTFLANETKSLGEIIQIARRKIAEREKYLRRQHFIAFRAIRKVKNIIKRIIR